MSTDPVCVYCGTPLEDDVYRCDRCGNKNANFGQPESHSRVLPYSMKLIGRGADGFNLSKKSSSPPLPLRGNSTGSNDEIVLHTPGLHFQKERSGDVRIVPDTLLRYREPSAYEQGDTNAKITIIVFSIYAVFTFAAYVYWPLFWSLTQFIRIHLSLNLSVCNLIAMPILGPIAAFLGVTRLMPPGRKTSNIGLIVWVTLQLLYIVLIAYHYLNR